MNEDDTILLDTNVLVYAFDIDEKGKSLIAKEFLRSCFEEKKKFVVSIQNLSEFYSIVTQKIKHPLSRSEASKIVMNLIEFAPLEKFEPSCKTIQLALDYTSSTTISYWDALIAAVMLEHGVNIIFTENIKDFEKIPAIKVINPFK